MEKIVPFFVNSNICFEEADICGHEKFMSCVAGNTGNSYITYSLIKELLGTFVRVRNIQSIYTYDFNFSGRDIDIINNECTHVILVLQDQIRIKESYGLQLPYDNIILFLKQIKKPIVVAGLGANSFNGYDSEFHKKLPTELVSFLCNISALTKTIGVRGEYTADVLSKIGIDNVRVIGCPSYYERGPDRKIILKKWDNISNIACSSGVSRKIFNSEMVEVYLQDESERDFIATIAFGAEGKYDWKAIRKLKLQKFKVFSSIDNWKKELAKNDLFIGMRVHGAILAINSGVPAVVMNGDSRAREICSFFNMPYRPDLARCKDIRKLYDACSCSYEEMNLCYKKRFCSYLEFLHDNGLDYHSEVNSALYRQPQLRLYSSSLKYTNDSFRMSVARLPYVMRDAFDFAVRWSKGLRGYITKKQK